MKLCKGLREVYVWSVAPLVGAWIEIMEKKQEKNNIHVAPLVGAWIEIKYTSTLMHNKKSLLL